MRIPGIALVAVGALLALVPTRAADPPGVLLSRQLAEARGLSVGDEVTLAASPSGAGARRFRVVGVYEPAPDPMKITGPRLEARLHLPDLLDLTAPDEPEGRDRVDAINVRLRDPAEAASVAADFAGRVPGLVARPTRVPDAENPFVALERFHLAIALVTMLAATAFLLALMIMRADERRETIGVLRLIGLTRRRVLAEVFVEGLIVAAVGALLGILLALACEDAFNRFFQWRYDTTLVFVRVTPSIVGRCLALALPLGVLAGVVASWTLLRRGVLELLRR